MILSIVLHVLVRLLVYCPAITSCLPKVRSAITKVRMNKFLRYVQNWQVMNSRHLNLAILLMPRMRLSLLVA